MIKENKSFLSIYPIKNKIGKHLVQGYSKMKPMVHLTAKKEHLGLQIT